MNLGPAAGSLGNYNEEQITVSFLSMALMSVVESGSTDCGGAHPNNHFNPFVLDLRRGGYLDFRHMFKGAAYRDYSLGFSPRMQALIRQAVDQQPEPRDDDDCTDLLPQYMAVMLESPDKVRFVISHIGHAMGVCLGSGRERAILPATARFGARCQGVPPARQALTVAYRAPGTGQNPSKPSDACQARWFSLA